ncbi:MAG TPA: HNH endonuclease [Syntrophobacteraceae bacterium]|nr:HNH endonuclease [Syntrophobacteraceae bacterium]
MPSLDQADQGNQPSDLQAVFLVQVSPERVQREKEKARALRKSRWWQRQMDRGICHYCRKPVARDEMTLDHVVPLIRGGQTSRSNVVLACKSCNSRKKYLLPMEWEEFLQGISSQDDGEQPLPDLQDTREVSGDE